MNLAPAAAARKRPRPPAHIAHTPERQQAPDARAALARLVPLPLAAVADVLHALRVPRTAAQQALNDGLKAGEVRLTHSGVLVVAAESAA